VLFILQIYQKELAAGNPFCINLLLHLPMTMELQFTLADIDQAAQQFWAQLSAHRVFAFHAPMGTGKTTFIRALCQAKGVSSGISSPTFSLINEYVTEKGDSLFHIDLYRLKDAEEARQAGVEDILYKDAICLVEWPEKALELLPDDTVHLTMEGRPTVSATGVVDTRYLSTFTPINHESI
jgi:tRNA threonylcarbamoyladenosine biosynthesis protein TsaE